MPITLKHDQDLTVGKPSPASGSEQRQRRRMVIALAVLLFALVVVLLRGRPQDSTAATDTTSADGTAPPENSSKSVQAPGGVEASREALPHPPPPMEEGRRSRSAKARTNTPAPEISAAAPPLIQATDRAVLPPLEVEVVAGNQRRALHSASSAVKVEMQPADNTPSPASGNSETAAVGDSPEARVVLSRGVSERVSRSVEPNYPLLAKQMKVQGAVVLQALIDKGGNIQDLRVVTGPTILAAAAREAVKQWHFKPYLQDGQAVETEARITVNFTISTY
jgi:periplasmic protein TonB